MKKLITLLAAALLALSSFAQGDWNTTVTYNIGFPVGNTADYIDEVSFRGVMVQGDYFISDEWTVGFIFGLQNFYQELGRSTYTEGTLTATGDEFRYLNSVPLLLSNKYHFNRFGSFTPHVGVGLGLYNMIETREFAGISLEKRNWQFGYAPNAGFGIELSPGTDFVVEACYNGYLESKDIDAQSYFTLQIGLKFTP